MSTRTLNSALCTALVVTAAGLASQPAWAESETGLALRQNALTVGWPIRPEGVLLPQGTLGVSETRLRAWLSRSWEDVRVTAALEVQSSVSSMGTSGTGFVGGSGTPSQSRPFEVVDLTWEQGAASPAHARLERLDVAWSWGAIDYNLGRQPVSLGTSRFVGVLDVLAPFAPGAMDASYKPGIDALRIRTALGDTGEAEVILAGSDPWRQGGTLGRLRNALAGMDLEILAGRFRDRGMMGLGWEGELGSAGVWGELALYERRPHLEQIRAGWSRAAFSGVVGADFNLPFDTRGGAALMYQDFGARRPEDLASVFTDAPFREGWAFLGSAGYGMVTASKAFHPLVNGSVTGLVNLIDGSTLWQPRLTFSISDNSDLGAYAWVGLGSPPRLDGESVTLGSEFGGIPTGVGLYTRWYF